MEEEQWKHFRKATVSLIASEKLRLIKFMDRSKSGSNVSRLKVTINLDNSQNAASLILKQLKYRKVDSKIVVAGCPSYHLFLLIGSHS